MGKLKDIASDWGDYTEEVYSAEDEAMIEEAVEMAIDIPLAVTQTLIAARHFDQMRAGDSVAADPTETYWANQLKAGNVYISKEV